MHKKRLMLAPKRGCDKTDSVMAQFHIDTSICTTFDDIDREGLKFRDLDAVHVCIVNTYIPQYNRTGIYMKMYFSKMSFENYFKGRHTV